MSGPEARRGVETPGEADPGGSENEAFWREYLTIGHPAERAARRVFVHLPHEPRCRIYAAVSCQTVTWTGQG